MAMDVKGLKWATNIYQKFEAMCLEVEEIVYQDTVKYVENQVQTVGASVKKFYSDVMEDLLPSPSLDPGKVANSEFVLEPFNHVEICKKPKPMIKKEPLKVDIGQFTKRSKAAGIEETNHAAVTSTVGTHVVDNLLPSTVLDGSENVAPPSELFPPTSFNNCTLLNGSVESEVPVNSGETDYQSSEVLKRNFKMSHQEISSACLASSESDQGDLLDEGNGETETRNEAISIPLVHYFPSNKSLLESESAQRSRSAKSNASIEGLSVVPRISDNSWDICTDSFGTSSINEDLFGNIHKETGLSNSECAVLDHSDEIKLGESCFIVDGDELQFVAEPSKGRPYKIKFRNVLSSRKRGSRAQEYKQLAAQFANNAKCHDESAPCQVMTLSSTESSGSLVAHSPGESEWELL
ncbi:hypothetical protein SAY86_028807 [Trapa natans]|uniref:Uncharacterized protein n=1 Tax=Trapa natans TaxID=22666 RepID=A0AAN7M053_TRANT|nr:hypothetical protein SAY86_028807 [Trapa natans]